MYGKAKVMKASTSTWFISVHKVFLYKNGQYGQWNYRTENSPQQMKEYEPLLSDGCSKNSWKLRTSGAESHQIFQLVDSCDHAASKVAMFQKKAEKKKTTKKT